MAEEHLEYEFMGPTLGPLGILLGLPAVCYGLVYTCNASGCMGWNGKGIPGFPPDTTFFSYEATAMVVFWIFLQTAIHLVLPGKKALGTPLRTGERLQYKLTALRPRPVALPRTGLGNLAVTAALAGAAAAWAPKRLAWVYDAFVPLLSAAMALSFALAGALYLASFRRGAALAAGGCSGRPLYDFFMGRELNPRLGRLDLKEFCELVPGLLGWLLIDVSMAAKQFEATGRVSCAMALVCAGHSLYVVDALWHESAILSTMDITTDGFGFMLAFGDLVWVPFTYSLQARYLVDHPQALSAGAVAGIAALQALGYAVFRGANSQKDLFRRNPGHPAVARLRTISTASGRRLLVSGWWGVARHINYLGDWLMGLAWCLPCGFAHAVPFFYAAYFGALLVHRDLRDEAACAKKYGRDWDRYCALVPYRLIPLVY